MKQYEEIVYASGSAAVGFWTLVSSNLHLETTIVATIVVAIAAVLKSVIFGGLTWFTTKTLNYFWDKKIKYKKSHHKNENHNP